MPTGIRAELINTDCSTSRAKGDSCALQANSARGSGHWLALYRSLPKILPRCVSGSVKFKNIDDDAKTARRRVCCALQAVT